MLFFFKSCHEMCDKRTTDNVRDICDLRRKITLFPNKYQFFSGFRAESISGIGGCVYVRLSVITSKMIIISARRLHRPL